MHEYSIVQSLLEQCESYAEKEGAQSIYQVVIKVGKLSGVEPELLKRAFDGFKVGTICEQANLQIHIQKLLLFCRSCEKESEQEQIRYQCKHCGSTDVKATDGEDMFLMSLEME